MTNKPGEFDVNHPDKPRTTFCDKHLNVRDCGFAHPFITHDGKCGFCELQLLRSKVERLEGEVTELKKTIEYLNGRSAQDTKDVSKLLALLEKRTSALMAICDNDTHLSEYDKRYERIAKLGLTDHEDKKEPS